MLENLTIGDLILHTDHDVTQFAVEKKRSQLNAFNALTARHENAKVGRTIKPKAGWVAECVKLNAPNLDSMTRGDHVWTTRRRKDASKNLERPWPLFAMVFGTGAYVPEFSGDSIIRDRKSYLRHANRGGFVLIDTFLWYYNGIGYESEYAAREAARRRERQTYANSPPPISKRN
jgi:hypothetical protein